MLKEWVLSIYRRIYHHLISEETKEYMDIIDCFTSEKISAIFLLNHPCLVTYRHTACYNHLYEIVENAAEKKSFIRIDMEDSKGVDEELEFSEVHQKFPHHVGS
jgi:hypothetical protein